MNNFSYKSGIDVSLWQGGIDWSSVVAHGVVDVVIRVSEGGTYTDPMFEKNWKGATAAGLHAGAYHYFRALSSTPKEQAENIKRNLETVGFDPALNMLALDIEQGHNTGASTDQMADNIFELLTLIKEDIVPGYAATIYTSPNTWNTMVNWQKYDFSVFPLWVAHWEAAAPTLPKSWAEKGKDWQRWQHSDTGRIPGIDAQVDLDWVK